jgi:hypothetical protein
MRAAWLGGLGVLALAMFGGRSPEPPTWSKDVAPIIHSQCSPCHTAGGHGPFPLETYRDVARRSELVRQELLKRSMPPVMATSDFGGFGEASRLTDEQLVMLQEWFQAGTPLGGPEPTAPKRTNGFRLGKPDLVLKPVTEPETPTEGNPVWCAVVIDPKTGETLAGPRVRHCASVAADRSPRLAGSALTRRGGNPLEDERDAR